MGPLADQAQRFAEYLEGLAGDQNLAALAALRRGLGKRPGEAAEMYRYVVPWVPRNATPRQEEPYYLVAALFAWHQGGWHGGAGAREATNFGASFLRLAVHMGKDSKDSVEQRFVALLNCHADDLPEHLRRAVGLLKSKEVAIDWAQLLRDIQGWGWESRGVQRSWARAYWGTERAEAAAAAPATTDQDGDAGPPSDA